MSRNFYCALCGGPLEEPTWELIEDEIDIYDPSILSPGDSRLAWVTKFRVLDVRMFNHSKEDPSHGVPTSELAHVAFDHNSGKKWIEYSYPENGIIERASTSGTAYQGMIPIHDDCHFVMKRYIGARSRESEAIYSEIVSNSEGDLAYEARCLNLDYGDISEQMQDYFMPYPGEEYFVFSPVDIPELRQYYENLPQLSDNIPTWDEGFTKPPSHNDPFHILAPEMFLNIMSYLDLESLGRFRLASRAACNVARDNAFWKTRVLLDLDFLFDLPDAGSAVPLVDWKRVFKDISLASRPYSTHTILGLANRRRIWEQMCPQIVDPALENLKDQEKRRGQSNYPEGSIVSEMKHLTKVPPGDVREEQVFLLDDLPLARAKVALLVYFDSRDQICGFGVDPSNSKDHERHDANPPEHVKRVVSCPIPHDDWPRAFLFISKLIPEDIADANNGHTQGNLVRRVVGMVVCFHKTPNFETGDVQGDFRLIYVPNQHYLLGIEMSITSENEFCGISLTYMVYKNAFMEIPIPDARRTPIMPMLNWPELTNYLWREDHCPPETVTPYGFQRSRHDDAEANLMLPSPLLPMEVLVFAECEEELADITEFRADVRFGGFEIRYGSRPPRSIGPCRQAMKRLIIDGKGGERMLVIHESKFRGIVCGLRFITNRERQMVIGHPGMRVEFRSGLLGWALSNYPQIAGIIGSWPQANEPKDSLLAFGYLSPKKFGHQWESPDYYSMESYQPTTCWEPKELPEIQFRAAETIGRRETPVPLDQTTRDVPNDSNVAGWLDCTRPLENMWVVTCHSGLEGQLQLSSLIFRYSDGDHEEASVGASIFSFSSDEGDGEDKCWCDRSDRITNEELTTIPHYTRHEWNLCGKKLLALRVWTPSPAISPNPGAPIKALQFVAEGGLESPVWSHWGYEEGNGEHLTEIIFSSGGGEAVVLGCYMGFGERGVRGEDMIVQAIQGLSEPDVPLSDSD